MLGSGRRWQQHLRVIVGTALVATLSCGGRTDDAPAGTGGVSGGGCPTEHGPNMVALPKSGSTGERYCMDATEVTQADYAAFLASSATESSLCAKAASLEPTCSWTPVETPNAPVVCVEWCAAASYCTWAGKRLCREGDGREWRDGCSNGGVTRYPYGDTYDAKRCTAAFGGELHDVGTEPECRGSKTPYTGLYDLFGSVEEWVDAGPDNACTSMGIVVSEPSPAPRPRRRAKVLVVRRAANLGPNEIEAIASTVAERLGLSTPSEPEPLLDRQQLADALSVSRATVDRMRKELGFPAHRVGDAPRFILSEVRHWLDKTDGGKAQGLRLVRGTR